MAVSLSRRSIHVWKLYLRVLMGGREERDKGKSDKGKKEFV